LSMHEGEAATIAKAERRMAIKRRMILVLNRELGVQSVRSRFSKVKAKKRVVAWR
jgi:hypothetical protein